MFSFARRSPHCRWRPFQPCAPARGQRYESARFLGGLFSREDGAHGATEQVFPELRDRAVRMVLEHAHEYPSQWAAIQSIAEKLSCSTEALRRWVR
jgi:hypothetical protein